MPLLRLVASLKLTVICLIALCFLTVFGTLYQVEHGIYEAKEMYFTSWFVLAGGFFPLPGAQLVMWLFSANLIASLLVRIKDIWRHVGLFMTHIGLLLICFSSFWTFLFSQESYLWLQEGSESNVSLSRELWELAIVDKRQGKNITSAITIQPENVKNSVLEFASFNIKVSVEEYFVNCALQHIHQGGEEDRLLGKSAESDPGYNQPGGIFSVEGSGKPVTLLGDGGAMMIPGMAGVQLALQKRRFPLPERIRLDDVKMAVYKGTGIAKSYESHVTVGGKGGRKVVISMNNPLRIGDTTFFQSGYQNGKVEATTLAVVKNSGRLLPYIASIVMGLGLLFQYFFIHLFRRSAEAES